MPVARWREGRWTVGSAVAVIRCRVPWPLLPPPRHWGICGTFTLHGIPKIEEIIRGDWKMFSRSPNFLKIVRICFQNYHFSTCFLYLCSTPTRFAHLRFVVSKSACLFSRFTVAPMLLFYCENWILLFPALILLLLEVERYDLPSCVFT